MASNSTSWKSYLALGLFFIIFSVIANLLLGAGADSGRLSSWALLGVPMGLVVVAIAFYQRKKER